MNNILRFLLIGLIAVAAVAVWDGFYVLREGQQAVITQFGRPVGQSILTAGLKFKLPVIQKVQYFDKRILVWDGDPNQIPTNDKTFIYMDNTARWRIVDPLRFLQAVGTERRAMTLLGDILDGTVRDLVVPPKVGRDRISHMVLEAASKITPQYGIELMDVMFKRVNYIESVRLKVYDRMISERKRIAAEKRSTGEGLKAEILGRVDRELAEITSKARREATEIRGAADAEATRIYGEAYSGHAEFFAFQKSLESYRNIITKNTSLILSSDSDLFHYLENQKVRK